MDIFLDASWNETEAVSASCDTFFKSSEAPLKFTFTSVILSANVFNGLVRSSILREISANNFN